MHVTYSKPKVKRANDLLRVYERADSIILPLNSVKKSIVAKKGKTDSTSQITNYKNSFFRVETTTMKGNCGE
jgi:hypothetical protein